MRNKHRIQYRIIPPYYQNIKKSPPQAPSKKIENLSSQPQPPLFANGGNAESAPRVWIGVNLA